MKSLIVLVVGLLTVGCGKPEPSLSSFKAEPSTHQGRKLSQEEEKLVGEYEAKAGGETIKLVLLENAKVEDYQNDEKFGAELTWEILEKEVHVGRVDSSPGVDKSSLKIDILKIESNGDLTIIALVEDGKRTDFPKDKQVTLKRIK